MNVESFAKIYLIKSISLGIIPRLNIRLVRRPNRKQPSLHASHQAKSCLRTLDTANIAFFPNPHQGQETRQRSIEPRVQEI